MEKLFMSAQLGENGNLEGKIRISYSNHNAMTFRESYFKTNEEDYVIDLEKKNGDMLINDFSVNNATDMNKPVTVTYECSMENCIDLIADKIYFPPMFFLKTKENPFKLDRREFPVDFGYPSGNDYSLTIQIPDGYTVESMPEPIAIALPDAMGSFKYNIVNQANMIQLKVVSDINHAVIPAPYYAVLKEYFKKVIEKMNEKVVLSKA